MLTVPSIAACALSYAVQDLGAGIQDPQHQAPAAYPTDALLGSELSAIPLQPVPSLVSGAGHDALAMADLTKASAPFLSWWLAAQCWYSWWEAAMVGRQGAQHMHQ